MRQCHQHLTNYFDCFTESWGTWNLATKFDWSIGLQSLGCKSYKKTKVFQQLLWQEKGGETTVLSCTCPNTFKAEFLAVLMLTIVHYLKGSCRQITAVTFIVHIKIYMILNTFTLNNKYKAHLNKWSIINIPND